LLTIMAAARPVLASMPLDGDAPKIIDEAQCGLSVAAGKPDLLAAAVLRLKRDSEATSRMAGNGRRYVETHFSRGACVARFEQLFKQLAEHTNELGLSTSL
jgi:glycosyltransferase involved in cell wall biosynthesis